MPLLTSSRCAPCSGTSMRTAYAASVRLRAALRVLHLLSIQEMDPRGQGYDELYAAIRRAAPWHEYLGPDMSLGVELRLRSCSDWNHSTAAQQCVQAAIADAVRDAGWATSALLACHQNTHSFASALLCHCTLACPRLAKAAHRLRSHLARPGSEPIPRPARRLATTRPGSASQHDCTTLLPHMPQPPCFESAQQHTKHSTAPTPAISSVVKLSLPVHISAVAHSRSMHARRSGALPGGTTACHVQRSQAPSRAGRRRCIAAAVRHDVPGRGQGLPGRVGALHA